MAMENGVLPHRLKYNVFLSFRGGDTRKNFCERLYVALNKKEKIRVFRDNEGMQRGDEINPSLDLAIEDSATSLIILSHHYADSSWCLNELALLCDLRSSLKRPIIPIFYGPKPSDVRKQSGHFVKLFEEHEIKYDEKTIQKWRRAMTLVGNIPGFFCTQDTVDDDDKGKDRKKVDDMIELVVKRVLAKVSNTPEKVADYTVGLESRVDDLVKLFDIESRSGVHVMGLYGMGGIGKTTLAKAFYNKIVGNFDKLVFISNVRERSSGGHDGLVNLQKEYIKNLTGSVPEIEDVNRGLEKIKENVREKKILAVLDDVDHIDQVEALVGETKWYSTEVSTLIVITTRDEKILSKLSVKIQQYEVKCLTEIQALKLFSFYSLRKFNPPKGSMLDLSKKILELTGMLPLAVRLFGSHLFDKDENEWPVELEKLKKTQPKQLHGVLALSFESLDDEEKKIFLDIACLFLKMEMTKEEVVDILKGCGFNAEAVLRVLVQKSLIQFLKDDTLWMHDQIRDMGRKMVINENNDDPEMRSRLWDRREIMNVLHYMQGTTSIRGIVFDFKKKFVRDHTANEIMSMNLRNNLGICSVFNYLKNKFVKFPAEEKPKTCEITIPVEPFEAMKKLRLLQINNMELEGNLKLLSSELKWIQWKGCPLETLPPDLLARKLGVLDLSESRVRQVQTLRSKREDDNLKVINLRNCHSLEAIPDLSNHKVVEKLVLERCELLVKVHKSVGNLTKLLHLDLRNCSRLSEFLADVSGLKSLENLFLSGCFNLSVLPKDIGDMKCLKKLLLDGTAIESIPESIHKLQSLKKLSLIGCTLIEELPESIGTLTSLEKLYLDDTTALKNLPDSIGDLKNLQELHMRRCRSISEIPDTINDLLSLKELFINGSGVNKLPLNFGSLLCLTDFSAGDCKDFKQVPSSMGGLNALLYLDLFNTPLEKLPEELGKLHFIRQLDLRNCKSLKDLPETIGDMDTLDSLNLAGSNIEKLPEDFGKLENLVSLRMNKCKKLKRLPKSFGDLKSLHDLYMEETLVAELPESFGNLSNLRVLKMMKKPLFRSATKSVASGTSEETHVELPNSFSNLLKLEEMDARSVGIFGTIPNLEKLSSLMTLNLGNNYFHSLPSSLVGLTSLKKLSLYDCQELTCLPPLPCKLEMLNLSNCFSLESISDLSELTILQELNLTNCDKVNAIPGLEKLTALKQLYMSGCNSTCSLYVKKRQSKTSLKMMRNLSLPGNRIPDWFSKGPLTFSAQPNKELRGVIIAVVVALNHVIGDEYHEPNLLDIEARILKLDLPVFTKGLDLSGMARTNSDQLHICRYSAFHPMVIKLKDGYTIQVIKREPSYKKGVELKMHGIHLVYEGDDDLEGNENTLPETQQTVSQKLANFFTSSEGESTVT